MAKARKKSTSKRKPRRNPTTLKNKRVLTPESCGVSQAGRLLNARKVAKAGHKRKPRRDATCTYQSAELKIQRGGGRKSGAKRKAPTKVRPRSAGVLAGLGSIVDDWFTPTGL